VEDVFMDTRVQTNAGSSQIEVRELVKRYTNGAGTFSALNDIDLDIARGEFVAIVGQSGSGKSTLLNMLAGIDQPDSGDVVIDGTAVQEMNQDQLARWRGLNIGIVFQFFQLLPTLTAVENVMLPMDFCHRFAASRRRPKAVDLLDRVGLADQADKLPTMLSGGQQQRVAIARALANDPPILLSDEPTGNLDSHTSEAIMQLFQQLTADNKTVVMVTHNEHLALLATQCITLADGEIVMQQGQEVRYA
jgi:putative ABC transport system ATP-binding protein